MKSKLGRKQIGAIIATVILMVCMTGCGVSSKVNAYLEQGEAYIASGDYTGAMEAYQAAIDLDMYSVKAHMGLLQSMLQAHSSYEEIYGVINTAVAATQEMTSSENELTEEQMQDIQDYYQSAAAVLAEEDIDASLEIMETGTDILGPNSVIANDYKDKVQQLVEHYLEGNNFEKAREYASRMEKTLPEDNVVKSTSAEVQERYDAEQAYVDVLLKAAELIESSKWQELADFSETEEVMALAEKIGDVGNYNYVFDGGNDGLAIGLYSMEGCECNEWYYGNLTDGQRDGEGGWYWAKNDPEGLYIDNYVGKWADDIPNGSGHSYIFSYGEILTDDDITVKNGLIDGMFTHEFNASNGKTYKSTYTVVDGIYQEVEIEDWLEEYIPEDRYVFCVVYYMMDGARRASYLTTYDGAIREGVAHFRNQ